MNNKFLLVLGIALVAAVATANAKPPAGGNTGGNTGGGNTGGGTAPPPPPPPVPSTLDMNKVLTQGSNGAEVRSLQTYINYILQYKPLLLPVPYYLIEVNKTPLIVDGSFGAKTKAHVQNLFNVAQITLNQAMSDPRYTRSNTGGATGTW